jgi:hypothetical protein
MGAVVIVIAIVVVFVWKALKEEQLAEAQLKELKSQ